jgi:hypothetical protein
MQIQRQSPATAPSSDARDTARLTIGIGIATRYAGVIIGALMINGALAAAPIAIFFIPFRIEYVALVMAAATLIVAAGFSVALAGLYLGTLVMAFGEILATGIDTALQASVLPDESQEAERQARSVASLRIKPQHSDDRHVQP